ncbi:U6 small nuclear RNA (adenine-(43)-N(6))-methyltransferase [Contarinia nasturtii]|uniref:U6 small nuclear RNA (adenine-(43)-N(6))-methyltransferase n=1 Tax=Contarinia nasturtii TaxID=265458 RepID=UPI0012D44BE5|nr:U6 small nuclear RNA (adenine-(43)-N(6))-methyltransferase [Contarinia nasturtii]
MAMNKFMHSRNVYNVPADFAKLAEEFEEFRLIVKTNENGKVHINFKDENAVKTLTTCLLKRDFNLVVHLPPKQLVPTLPLRLNYILWLEDIVKTFRFENVIGLDIGCGASCIYPLLATRMNSNWRMFAIELNEESVKYARDNVNKNGLSDHIRIIECASNDDPLDLFHQHKDWDKFDFTMCNPPFFEDEHESDTVKKRQSVKRKPANNAKTGISCELTTAGGEVEFVKKMIKRSGQLRNVVNVFTTMLGHKTSMQSILKELKDQRITNVCCSEFCQGWTKRWSVAWTFRNDILLRRVPITGQTQPKPPHRFLPNDIDDPDIATKKLCQILSELTDVKLTNRERIESGQRFQFIAITDSWKNQRRKRRQQTREQQKPDNKEEKGVDLEIIKKRIKLDQSQNEDHVQEAGQEEVMMNRYSSPHLHIDVTVELKTLSEFKAIVEVKLTYLNGIGGVNGVYELLQFIQNKW